MVYDGSIIITIVALLFFGAAMGVIFNFLKWEHGRGLVRNIGLGIIGAIAGWGFAGLLPILPAYRFAATLTLTLVCSLEVMVGYWMISRKKTPIIYHDENYEAAKEDDGVGEHPEAS